MLKRALNKAKKGDDKKVNINFQVPSTLREEFDKLCKDNNVSLTSMLNSLIEVAIEENQGFSINDQSVKSLIDELGKAEKAYETADSMISQGFEVIDDAKDQYGNLITIDFNEMRKSALVAINAIRAELEKRGAK